MSKKEEAEVLKAYMIIPKLKWSTLKANEHIKYLHGDRISNGLFIKFTKTPTDELLLVKNNNKFITVKDVEKIYKPKFVKIGGNNDGQGMNNQGMNYQGINYQQYPMNNSNNPSSSSSSSDESQPLYSHTQMINRLSYTENLPNNPNVYNGGNGNERSEIMLLKTQIELNNEKLNTYENTLRTQTSTLNQVSNLVNSLVSQIKNSNKCIDDALQNHEKKIEIIVETLQQHEQKLSK